MNHREPLLVLAGARKALRCLSLLLLPALAFECGTAWGRPRGVAKPPVRTTSASLPYLPVVGPPPLRFQEPAPPPDLATRPAVAAPPTLPGDLPDIIPAASIASAQTTAPATAAQDETSAEQSAETASPETRSKSTPLPILPDDTRPQVRPEDFLPFFQLPGTSTHPGDATIMMPLPRSAPAPAPLPSSSAIYNLR